MEERRRNLKLGWFTVVTMIIALMVLSIATYAWFQMNKLVDTSVASARSGSENITLELSSTGGAGFKAEEKARIVQVNSADRLELMPVSTADLSTFVTNRHTDGGIAKTFSIVDNEDYLYHGRVYLRARAGKEFADTRMSIYLDQTSASGGRLFDASSEEFVNASRLGLTVGGGPGRIFSLSESESSADKRALNTSLNGVIVGGNQVLDASSGSIRAVKDPSVLIDNVCIKESGDGYSMPGQEVCTIELNRIYQVDVYLYLEGCDPDCTNPVSYDTSKLHLAFFGMLKE